MNKLHPSAVFRNSFVERMIRHTVTFAVVLFGGVTGVAAADWETTAVPGAKRFTGYAWYRTWFKPHDSFFSKHERDLFGESAVLNIRGLAGAHTVYINGKEIGSGGVFPPVFQDGREGNHRHKIPSGRLVRDQWNEVAIKVFNPAGRSTLR